MAGGGLFVEKLARLTIPLQGHRGLAKPLNNRKENRNRAGHDGIIPGGLEASERLTGTTWSAARWTSAAIWFTVISDSTIMAEKRASEGLGLL
ncbi:hypothetical protein [Paenibacillus darwinianus]|uniref:hypothetical protein n=1 Tax=Paenibacillus darwinianus TaxID=1380763 RepID=UPI0011868F95|nr:hypothetical protein [Paenibacillus darwinianus]